MGLVLPFSLRSFDGLVTVDYGANEDPRRWGYHLLRLPYDTAVAEGFPVLRATVSYDGEGYAAAMGWIQVIRYAGDGVGEDEVVEVDHPPQLSDAGTPYYCWGTRPSFFDAPSMTREDVTWIADAFLVASPDALMTKTIQAVCGFRWGYTTRRQPPELLPVEPTGAGAWESATVVLREHYPAWNYLP